MKILSPNTKDYFPLFEKEYIGDSSIKTALTLNNEYLSDDVNVPVMIVPIDFTRLSVNTWYPQKIVDVYFLMNSKAASYIILNDFYYEIEPLLHIKNGYRTQYCTKGD